MIYFAEKMRGHEYVEALEEEKRKIQVFQRELPLCLELVNQAIETCKQQRSGSTTATECMHGGQSQSESECSEDTSSEAPALQDLFSLKMCSSNSNEDDDVNEQQSRKDEDHHKENNNDQSKKVDWLRSAGLWNPSPSDPPSKEDVTKKACVIEAKRNGGAFQPFNREKCAVRTGVAQPPASKAPPCAVPAAEMRGNGSNKKEEKGQNQRKQRRCWSPELHRRFLNALQQLGGSHVATPKQIRELMNVDGLTNDEVKSHLQKYRLHTRRPSPAVQNNGTPQASQFVVVGGIWMPPSSEYAATIAGPSASGEASNVTTANGVYAPVAAPVARVENVLTLCQNARQGKSESLNSEERGSHSEGLTRSNSPATSSSTHTTTASPLF